jgi:tRNA pseudouridine synthase 10
LEAAAGTVGREALASLQLDDRCLGRLFAKVGRGMGNDERGAMVRQSLSLQPAGECQVCRGLFDRLETFVSLVEKALLGWEGNTFLVGCRIDPAILEAEELLWTRLGVSTYEPIKSEVNREVGKRVEARTGRTVDFEEPEIVAILDTTYHHVDLQVAPLLIYGRYRKLVRGIPQTRWPCRVCRGKGCERCGFQGKMYPTSVQEVIAGPVMERTLGEDHAFHGMGREDVDARMLGEGRPFILEVRRPRKRTVDLEALAAAVNASGVVEVGHLRHARTAEVAALKEERGDKTYRIVVSFPSPPPMEKLKKGVSTLEGAEILQRTPSRVVHRRADRTRGRKVKEARLVSLSGSTAEILVRTEAGTYVKELVHGDQGRTTPSLAEILGMAVEVQELDVVGIHDGERPW